MQKVTINGLTFSGFVRWSREHKTKARRLRVEVPRTDASFSSTSTLPFDALVDVLLDSEPGKKFLMFVTAVTYSDFGATIYCEE